jgi:hypothetical protein
MARRAAPIRKGLALLLWAGVVLALIVTARADEFLQGPAFGGGAAPMPPGPQSPYPMPPPQDQGAPLPPQTNGQPTAFPNFGTLAEPWTWQALPEGLIYRSYLAGVKEPRLGLMVGNAKGFGPIWDSTLGGRVALLRYGTTNAARPEGWELDFYGAALPRLQSTLPSTPLTATDYIVGLPITYGQGPWQWKTGYAHVSSHLGDEFMQLNPSVTRINYVRDSIMCGLSYFYTDDLRLFFEVDYAAGIGGGAKPWQFQLGADYSPFVHGGAPFAAIYADLRPEIDGGYFVVQTGWQYRSGQAMHTLRFGVEYLNGACPQYEFFRQFEQHFGGGVWYDY